MTRRYGLGPWLIRATPSSASFAAGGVASPCHDVHRKRRGFHHTGYQPLVDQAGHEQTVGTRVGIEPAAFNRRLDHALVVLLRCGLEEDVRASI